MCGIVGYIGQEQAAPVLFEGLSRLEYRGYDSVGIGILNGGPGVTVLKATGKVENLAELIEAISPTGKIGIGHNRWATNGAVTDSNAHPHGSCQNDLIVVHNGIIENFAELKTALQANGHSFRSDTDTEVLAHLIEEAYQGNLLEAVRQALQQVKGSYALVVLHQAEKKLVAAKKESPLLIGKGKKCLMVASDFFPFQGQVEQMFPLDDGDIAELTEKGGIRLFSLETGQAKRLKTMEPVPEMAIDCAKGQFQTFMLKEIMEQPEAIKSSFVGRLNADGSVHFSLPAKAQEKLVQTDSIIITACGTAYYAALLLEMFLEDLAVIPARAMVASEMANRPLLAGKGTIVIAISQSGETADTLAALKLAREKGLPSLGIVNSAGSAIAREVDAVIHNNIGREIAVASTKAFVSQVVISLLLALFIAQEKGRNQEKARKLAAELNGLPELVKLVLKQTFRIADLAAKYSRFPNFLFLGRGYYYPIALEGALKLKEISYLHAEACPAGEMKHGPIAMIDRDFATVAIVPESDVREKTLNNLMEIKARGGPILAIATEGDKKIGTITPHVISIPPAGEYLSIVLATVVAQLFAYFVADILGLDADQPRNLAKSVTVQ